MVVAAVYNYTSYSYDVGSSLWQNPAYSVDQTDDTLAMDFRDAGDWESTDWLLGTAHNGPGTAPAGLDTISKVELGIEGGRNSEGCVGYLRPKWGGTTESTDETVIPDLPVGYQTDDDVTHYVDVTSKQGYPSPWTWNDVVGLDLKTWCENSDKLKEYYVDQMRIRVTYTVKERKRSPSGSVAYGSTQTSHWFLKRTGKFLLPFRVKRF